MGEEVEAFEEEWARYCKANYCVAVSSGTDALYLALIAFRNNGDLVTTTPFTFFATSQAIMASGNRPYFMDVDEATGNLPDVHFGKELTVPVNLYGRPCNWRGDYVIVDAAQSHGVRSSGIATCYSFYPTKNLGAMGQAGAVVTSDVNMVNKVREMRTYGERERFVHYGITGNYRMDELQAAILRIKLPYLDIWNSKRRVVASMYRGLLRGLRGIIIPEDHPQHVYHIYAIRCKNRDSLAEYLKVHGIQTSVRYPVPMHLQPALRCLGHHKGDFPNAEAWAAENLSLPMYPELTGSQVEYVCEKVKEWANAHCDS